MEKQYYVYILASRRNGALYTGITSNLIKRVWEHKEKAVDGFTKRYNIEKLVYEILAEYPAFQSGDECLIIKFILMNRHHKETLAKRYKSCNIEEKGIIQRSYKMMSIVKPRLLRQGGFTILPYMPLD